MTVSLVVMGTDALHRAARNALGRLARAQIDNDVFRWVAAEVLRRAIGREMLGPGGLGDQLGAPLPLTVCAGPT